MKAEGSRDIKVLRNIEGSGSQQDAVGSEFDYCSSIRDYPDALYTRTCTVFQAKGVAYASARPLAALSDLNASACIQHRDLCAYILSWLFTGDCFSRALDIMGVSLHTTSIQLDPESRCPFFTTVDYYESYSPSSVTEHVELIQ